MRADLIEPKKPESIQQMFDRISGRYDLANAVLSFGTHLGWKRKLVKRGVQSLGSRPRESAYILDCATGTGDLARLWARSCAKAGITAEVEATDFSDGMLASARAKSPEQDRGAGIQFRWADVTGLGYEDGYFDCASISFGIRNVADPVQGLSELGRVVRPGGTVLVLEFGQPKLPIYSGAYRLYSNHILPRIGGWISGDSSAYSYLNSSSAAFPCREEFLKLARSTGRFSHLTYESLSGGVVYLYRLKTFGGSR